VALPYRKQGQKEQQEEYFFHLRGEVYFSLKKLREKDPHKQKTPAILWVLFFRTLFFENSLNQLPSFLVYRRETYFQLI
jgi:hypothetical protein